MRGLRFYAPVTSLLLGVVVGVATRASFTWIFVGAFVLVAMGSVLVGFSRSRWFHAKRTSAAFVVVTVTIGAFCGGFLRGQAAMPAIPDTFLPLVGRAIEVSGVVVAIPDEREGRTQLTVDLLHEGEEVRVLARVPPYPRASPGDLITLTGRLEIPRPFQGNAGRAFAYDRFLAKDGIVLVLQHGEFESIGQSPDPWLRLLRWLDVIRSSAVEALERALPEPESGLAVGILFGSKQGLGKDLLDDFTAAGLIPIVVLSGYNVAIVATAVRRALYRVPTVVSTSASIVAISCFVLAAGAGASAVRAALMACTAIVADATGRSYLAYRSLALSLCLIALFSPAAILDDPGLQLSFLATLGLLIGTPLLECRLVWIRWSAARTLVASTLAAQVGVLPHLLWLTGNLSLVAIPANLLALPLVPLAMAASAAAIPIALVPLPLVVSSVAGLPAYGVLAIIVTIAQYAAALPFSLLTLPPFPLYLVGVAYVVLAIVAVQVQRYAQKSDRSQQWYIPDLHRLR